MWVITAAIDGFSGNTMIGCAADGSGLRNMVTSPDIVTTWMWQSEN
jgi:hypothetical protein